MQSTQATCGPTALYNAMCALGKRQGEGVLEKCEKACKTTAISGTSPENLAAAAKLLGLRGTRYHLEDSSLALDLLRSRLWEGRPVCLIVDQGEHWVTVCGTLGDRFLMADSADLELLVSVTAANLLKRWRDQSFCHVTTHTMVVT